MKIFIDNEIIDKNKMDKEPPLLKKYFEERGNVYQLKTVGVIFLEKDVIVFLPKNTSRETFRYIDINKIFLLLKKMDKFLILKNGVDIDVVQKNELFSVIEWLICDFKANGIVKKMVKKETLNGNSKINWAKTVSKVKPIIVKNNIIFPKYIGKEKDVYNNLLTRIHIYVMNEIAQNYGESIFGFKYKNNSYLNMTIKDMENYLKSSLKIENNRRNKKLIKNLESFLHLLNSGSEVSVTTKEFHIIWEYMIKKVFKNDNDLLGHEPNAQWNLNINGLNIKGKNEQIPDVMVSNEINKEVNILDAKYYDLSKIMNGEKNVPLNWYSVVKQFFYDISFNPGIKGYKIKGNYFIFPYYKKNYSDDILTDIGQVFIDIGNGEEKSIRVMMIPTFSLIDRFLTDDFDDFFQMH